MSRNLACSKLIFSYAKPKWSRDTRVCDPNRDKTNMQHKKQVLQYRKNSAHFTKSQRYTNMVTGKGPLGNKVWASQSETESIPNIHPEYPVVSNRIMCVNTYACNPKGFCERRLDGTQTKSECDASCIRWDYGCVNGICEPDASGGNQTLDACTTKGCPGWGCTPDSLDCSYLGKDKSNYTKADCQKRGCGYDCSYVCNSSSKECSGNCISDPDGGRHQNACEATCTVCSIAGGGCENDSDCCDSPPAKESLYCNNGTCQK